MIQDIKNTIRQSAIYGLSRISTKLVAFILLPIYSHYFSISDYGVIVRIETLWQILWSVYLFGLESGIVRWYNLIQEEDRKRKFLFSVFLFLIVTNIIYTFGLYFASGQLSNLIFGNSNYSNLLVYTSLIATFESLAFVVFLLIRIKEKPLMYSIFSVLATLLNLGFQVYYIVYTNHKLEGVFIAKVLSPLIIIILLLPFLIKFIKIGLELSPLKELILYSFPSMLSSLAGMLLIQVDRYILGYLTDSREVGIYGLGYNICGIINFVIISPFSLAFLIISWKKLSDENAKRFYTKTITYLFYIVLFFSIILSLSTPYFIKLLNNNEYWAAKDIVPWLSITMPFYGIAIVGFFSFYVSKNTKKILICYLIALIVNIAANILLIPYFKMYGAALANFISYSTMTIVIYTLSKKEYFYKYEWRKIIYMLLTAIALLAPFSIFKFESIYLDIFLRIFSVVLFPILLYFLNFYEPVEIRTAKKMVYKIFKLKLLKDEL